MLILKCNPSYGHVVLGEWNQQIHQRLFRMSVTISLPLFSWLWFLMTRSAFSFFFNGRAWMVKQLTDMRDILSAQMNTRKPHVTMKVTIIWDMKHCQLFLIPFKEHTVEIRFRHGSISAFMSYYSPQIKKILELQFKTKIEIDIQSRHMHSVTLK